MTESAPGRTPGWRYAFRTWRRNRPLWGCVFVFLSGLELWGLTANPYELTVVQGVAGVSGLMIFGVLGVLALVCLLQPSQHTVTGALCVVVALASLPLSNLGGLMVGMLLGVHGGALMVSWRPPEDDGPVTAAVTGPVAAAVPPTVVPALEIPFLQPSAAQPTAAQPTAAQPTAAQPTAAQPSSANEAGPA